MSTVANSRGAMPPQFVMFLAGLIIMLVRMMLTMIYIWAACLCGIVGFQIMQGYVQVDKLNLFALPPQYYHSAAYMAICFAVLAGMLKLALNEGLFYTYDNRRDSEKPAEKPDTTEKPNSQ